MNKLNFWHTWQKRDQSLYLALLLVLIGALLWYSVSYYIGVDAIIHWTTEGSVHTHRVVADSFNKHLFEFTADADSYSIMNEYVAGNMEVNFTGNYIYAALIAIGMITLLSAATFMSRIWYAAVTGFFLLFLAKLSPEMLGIPSLHERLPLIIAMVSYMSLSYYFHEFDTRFSVAGRFLGFLLLTAVLTGIALQFSTVQHPILYINNYGIVIPLIMTVIFIGFNAHEIINGFLYLITHSSNVSSRNTPMHFIIISSVYLVNLFYGYLVSSKMLNWNILYIHPLIILPITLILGLWGFRKREKQYQDIVGFAPHGAFLYLGFALISIATASYIFASGNDPLIEVLEDAVLYTHLGFGIGFVLYTLSNFYNYLKDNKQVHKVIYSGVKVEFMWVAILGGVLIGLLVLRSNYFSYKQTIAGYYNGLGDTYMAENEMLLSREYYGKALDFEHQNHKSNYALGSLMRLEKNDALAYFYFEQALLKQPSPYAYNNLSQLLNKNKSFLDALFKLQTGLRHFPKSGELYNNVAMTYSKTAIADSVIFYLALARQTLKDPAIAEANMYAFRARYAVENLDTLDQAILPKEYLGTDNNHLVIANQLQKRLATPLNRDYLTDSVLQTLNMCYLYNYTLNQLGSGDTAMVADLRRFEAVEANYEFLPFLQLARSLKLHEAHNDLEAMRTMRRLHFDADPTNPYYAHMLGLWLLEMERYTEAAEYFKIAAQRGHATARLNQAIALSELPDQNPALEIWQELAQGKDPAVKEAAHDILRFMHADSVTKLDVTQLQDEERYRLAHYNHQRLSDAAFNEVLNKIGDANYKWLAGIDRIRYYLNRGNVAMAEQLRNSITGLNAPASEVLQELKLMDLHLLYALKQYDKMKNVLREAKFERANAGYQTFYSAVVATEQGDTATAVKSYQTALQQLPYHSEVPIRFAQFYNRHKQPEKAYNLLVDALHIYPDYHSYPPDLFGMYILQCVELQYESYAQDGMNKMQDLVSPQEYEKFKLVYEQRQKELGKEFQDWQ